jgi:SAM-dependent methyltransferase
MLKKKKLKAKILEGNMINIPFNNNYFDVIVDVFSSCHLSSNDGEKYINSCFIKLKKNGLFFSYFPSKKSTMFKKKKNIYLDKNTLFNNINVKTLTAYRMNNIPFRFLTKSEYCKLLKKKKFKIKYSEELNKSYFNGKENFTFNVIVAKKNKNF